MDDDPEVEARHEPGSWQRRRQRVIQQQRPGKARTTGDKGIINNKQLVRHVPPMEQQSDPPPVEVIGLPETNVLGQLALVLAETTRLQEEAGQLVSQAREEGVTWAEIAAVAGIKPQSAYQRWSEIGRAKHAAYQRKRRTPAD